ncbi:MAG: hypothetical protein HC794_01790 [Nitrospiraceae bacterium]|nr:hypothetical protein [Nitrospiraceae bacterium]
MNPLFYLAAMVLWLMATVEPALATCQTQTIFLPGGKTLICTTCHNGGQPTTMCF